MGNILKYVYPASILAGTIIGAGMFSLPFIFSESSFLIGLLYLALFTFIFYLVHSMYADIILRTERLPGFVLYVRKYLGEWARIPSIIATGIGTILVSAAYLILSVSFAQLIFPDISPSVIVFLFWAIGSFAIFLKAKKIAMIEFIVMIAILFLIGFIFVLGIQVGDFSNKNFYLRELSIPIFFIPFGPVLFSLSGRSAITPLLDDMKKSRLSEKYLTKIIFWGTAIPSILYIIFVLGIWGLSSDYISDDSVAGITNSGNFLLPILGVVGIAALFTTYVPIGSSLKKMLEADFKFSHLTAGILVVVLPPMIYFLDFGFLELIDIAGGIFLAVECIFIALIWNKLNELHKPRLLLLNFGKTTAYFVILIFAIGMIAEIIYP